MARRVATRDPDDDDDDFDDYGEGDSGEPTKECPYCHEEIHEDSVRCPHCETYLSEEDRPASSKSWLIIIGTLLSLFAVYWWIARG